MRLWWTKIQDEAFLLIFHNVMVSTFKFGGNRIFFGVYTANFVWCRGGTRTIPAFHIPVTYVIRRKRNPSTSVELLGGSLLSAGTIVGTFACRLHALNSIRVGNTSPTSAVAGNMVSGGLAFDTAIAKRQNIQRAAMGRRLGYRKDKYKRLQGGESITNTGEEGKPSRPPPANGFLPGDREREGCWTERCADIGPVSESPAITNVVVNMD